MENLLVVIVGVAIGCLLANLLILAAMLKLYTEIFKERVISSRVGH